MRVNDTVRVTQLSRRDFIADKAFKASRRAGARGLVSGVLGQRRELFLVIHEGESTLTAYLEEELELEPAAYWRLTFTQAKVHYFVEVATHWEAEELQDQAEEDGATAIMIEGPFYSAKELCEGLMPPRSLFDHLKEQD